MIIYEVRLFVQRSAWPAYRQWLKPHIDEVLRFPGFVKADLMVSESQDSAEVLAQIHYWVSKRSSLEDYFTQHAPRMRAQGLEKFPNQFRAERNVFALDQSFRSSAHTSP